MTFDDVEQAIDGGRCEMQRPWGDWVRVRRAGPSRHRGHGHVTIPLYMENDVEAFITTRQERHGFPGVRIVAS